MRLAFALLALPLVFGISDPSPACAGARSAETALRLNEFVAGPARDWDGSGAFSSRDDEWIEIKNAGAVPIDLAAYLLTDGDSIPRFAPTGTLAPEERLVVFGRDAYNWEREHGFPAFGFSLGNSGDLVLLWRVLGPETLLVDSYAYRSHEAAADRSVGRSNDQDEWALFDGLNPYSGTVPPRGTGCEPTPGGLNRCGSTAARRVTWGRVKTLYR